MTTMSTMSVQDSTLKKMACLLSPATRLQLFNDLCRKVGEPVPERVWLATGIRKTDVYRYLPKTRSSRGGHVPGPAITFLVIRALLKNGGLQEVLTMLDPVETELRQIYRDYFSWKRRLRRSDIIYSPWSTAEMRRLRIGPL